MKTWTRGKKFQSEIISGQNKQSWDRYYLILRQPLREVFSGQGRRFTSVFPDSIMSSPVTFLHCKPDKSALKSIKEKQKIPALEIQNINRLIRSRQF